MSFFPTLILFLVISSNVLAATKLDPLIGVRMSQLITQTVLASPPQPSLVRTREHHLIPQVSYLIAEAEDSTPNEIGSMSYNGKFSGWTAGLGFTESTQTKLSYYGFAIASRSSGSITIYDNYSGSTNTNKLSDMNNSSYSIAGGLSYRLWDVKSFPISLGILLGPFASRFDSSFNIT